MQSLPNKYILTGGPWTGKTTLLKLLAQKGFQIVNEAATILIKEELSKNGPSPWEDVENFQKKLFYRQLKFESGLKKTPSAFLDRGVIDGIAYSVFYNVKKVKEAIQFAKTQKYAGVFLLDFIKNFKNNYVRREKFEDALKIQIILQNTYEEFGYSIIKVPAVSVFDRAHFILQKITELETYNIKTKSLKNLRF